MKTKLKNQIKDALQIGTDRVIFHSDGTVTAKRGFFYRRGGSPEKFQEKVLCTLRGYGIEAKAIECSESWAAWPKSTYWVCRFSVKVTA